MNDRLAPGPPQRPPPALDISLSCAGALVLLLGACQHVFDATATATFDRDPGVRALGVALCALAWLVWVSARLTATGTRRALGLLAACALGAAGALRLAGPEALAGAHELLPLRAFGGARALAAGLALLVAGGYVTLTSPARRWRR